MVKLKYYIIILALLVVSFFAVRGCIKEQQRNKSFQSNYTALQDSAQLLKDKNGTLHARIAELQLTRDQAALFFGKQIDSLADLLKIKPKRIKSIVQVPFRTDTIHKTDTIYNGLMTLTRYEQGAGFLGLKKKQFLDVHFDSPIFKPLDVTGFEITKKHTRFSVGPYVGFGWDGGHWAPSVGISIQYNLIRF